MGMTIKYQVAFGGVGFLLFQYARVERNFVPLLLWILGWLAFYVLSLYRHPRRPCWYCHGSGKHKGALFGYSSRPCTYCAPHGGWELRWGARMLGIHPDGPAH